MTEWHVFKLEFVDDDEGADRVSLFMDGNATVLVRDRVTCETLEQAASRSSRLGRRGRPPHACSARCRGSSSGRS